MPRSLLQKLGIKEGDSVYLHQPPDDYRDLLGEPLPKNVSIIDHLKDQKVDFIHLFTHRINELEELLPEMQEKIVSNGMIWVSWYKKSSKLPTEINEDIIRDTALALKLVDVKVCSVSDQWSALKLVIRKELR